MSKDELREELAAIIDCHTDHPAMEHCVKAFERHVQRETAAFAEQAAQLSEQHDRDLMDRLDEVIKEPKLHDKIRSLSPKTFEEMVRDVELEARWKVLSQLRYVWNTKPNCETWDWIASEEEKALHELTEAKERIASLEREREARKGGSRR